MRRSGRTPKFRTADGQQLRGSIAETGYRRLGGLDQWVMIRGARTANPVLIFLHGGPGFSETTLHRRYNAELEESLTVVYWDQRGAGKSFSRGMPAGPMTVDQFIADLDDLVDSVRERLDKTTVALAGHSWGSALGALYASRFPDKVSAYVGSGQIGDAAAAEAALCSSLMAEALRRRKSRAVKQLRSIGPPPYDVDSALQARTWLQRFDGQAGPKAKWRQLRLALEKKESSLRDVVNQSRGFRFSIDTLWDEMSALNLLELAPALQIPTFFFLGRQDRWVPPHTSAQYFDFLSAPHKKLLWFEQSGRQPHVDEPSKFNRAMVELVRPSLVA